MKRLIDGVTYNTDTATLLAKSEYEGDWNDKECLIDGELYQTRGGTFFIVEHITIGQDADGDDVIKTRMSKCHEETARNFINIGEVEVFLNPLEDKVDEDETMGTIYARILAALKRKIEAAAAAEGLSANAWAMRCFERCLKSTKGALVGPVIDSAAIL
jgi:hypothetical protein